MLSPLIISLHDYDAIKGNKYDDDDDMYMFFLHEQSLDEISLPKILKLLNLVGAKMEI